MSIAKETRLARTASSMIGRMIAKPGGRDALLELMHGGTSAMPGCLSYILATDPTDAADKRPEFVFINTSLKRGGERDVNASLS